VGRAVASGTLLSVGAVDPRGKTERTLETPRMFFSQQSAADEAYFKPGKIPAVTVHQTLETETVKLSDSIDPRRAKTIPRLDRVVLPQPEDVPSAAPMMLAGPGSAADSAMPRGERWTDSELGADPASLPSNYDRQIHASLSAFRDQGEPSYSLDGAPTRQEPLGRRAAEVEPSLPEPSAVPTHRDLPAHRIEASQPPPAPVGAVSSRGGKRPDVGEPESEGPRPTTASIAAEEPVRRPVWINYAAFAAALLLALVAGFYLTREPDPGREVEKTRAVPPTPALPALPPAPAEAKHEPPKVATPAVEAEVASSPPPALATPAAPPAAAKKAPSPPAAAPPPAAEAPPKPAPKSQRETIF
jgi:hypothetical protein